MTEIDLRSVKRIAGFLQTLKDYGLPYHYIQRSNEPFSIALGGKLLNELLLQQPDIQAVFFANDDLAAGALFECQRRGIRVPEQLAIIGFNDQEIASSTIPTITSVRTPHREIGQIPAQMLVDHLQGRPRSERQVDLGLRFEVFTCGAILGRSGHHLVLHTSKNWSGYSKRKSLFNNLLHWPSPTSPKFPPPIQSAA